jgi:hypothetical protein
MREISCVAFPTLEHAFFKQAVFECEIGDHFFERLGFAAQVFDLAGRGGAGRVAG